MVNDERIIFEASVPSGGDVDVKFNEVAGPIIKRGKIGFYLELLKNHT